LNFNLLISQKQKANQKAVYHLVIELDIEYKTTAKQDEDFKNLWQDKDFLALVGE
jgi:hypothetical protein